MSTSSKPNHLIFSVVSDGNPLKKLLAIIPGFDEGEAFVEWGGEDKLDNPELIVYEYKSGLEFYFTYRGGIGGDAWRWSETFKKEDIDHVKNFWKFGLSSSIGDPNVLRRIKSYKKEDKSG